MPLPGDVPVEERLGLLEFMGAVFGEGKAVAQAGLEAEIVSQSASGGQEC
jgi:hypothetical protein